MAEWIMQPRQAIPILIGQGFTGPAWLMLGAPSFGWHPGYWGCFWLLSAGDSVLSSFVVVLRMRRTGDG